jgi:hypothetical protein
MLRRWFVEVEGTVKVGQLQQILHVVLLTPTWGLQGCHLRIYRPSRAGAKGEPRLSLSPISHTHSPVTCCDLLLEDMGGHICSSCNHLATLFLDNVLGPGDMAVKDADIVLAHKVYHSGGTDESRGPTQQ